MLTEEHCCGDDLVDEDPSKVPHDKVRRFETKRSALRLDLKKKKHHVSLDLGTSTIICTATRCAATQASESL